MSVELITLFFLAEKQIQHALSCHAFRQSHSLLEHHAGYFVAETTIHH
ncbi:hypothetical protein GGI1_11728 [Acidithiobacillus sp. GGI-221]|nr:hypothetical protein GGI1_11728 [Acidithiobacillus sp. GGI-221]